MKVPRKSLRLMRRMIVPVGRGRVGKTTMADAVFEVMEARGELVAAWDIDKAPSLRRRVPAAVRPDGSSDFDRRICLENAIHELFGGEANAVVDMGADDLLFHQIADKLPKMGNLLAQEGIEVVAIHVLGPDSDKDLAYFNATKEDAHIFARQIVALNHGLVRDGSPHKAFAPVRKIVESTGFPIFEIPLLPTEVTEAMWPEKGPAPSLDVLAQDRARLKFVNSAVLQSWLYAEENSISCIVDEILNESEPLPEAA